jgi:N-methylhydantoinase B/oxoprolinase/acetone carboxylase alpha subunit
MKSQKTEDIINRVVIANRLDSITAEMGLTLERCAHSRSLRKPAILPVASATEADNLFPN